MPTSLPPTVSAVRGALGQRALALALPLLLLPLLAACSALLGAGPDATIYAAEKTGAVSALDAANGEVLWRYHYYGVMGLAIDPDHHALFLTSPDGTVAALDSTTGKLDWRYAIGAGDWLNKPYLVGSMVVTAAQQVPGSPAGGSVIVAVDARSGAPLWRVSLPGGIAGDLDVHTDRIYASVNTANGSGSAGPGAIYALRTTDGAQVWRVASPATLVAGPVSDQTQVYAPTNVGSVFALRASDGALQWNQNISDSGPLSALFADSTAVYVGDSGATVRALRKADGSVLWTHTIPNTATALQPLYTPSDGGSLVLLTSGSTQHVDALSPSDGSVVWSQETLPEMSPPSVLGGYIYVGSGNEFTILSLASGRYVADYNIYLTSPAYTPAEQADLNEIAYIVAGPSRV